MNDLESKIEAILFWKGEPISRRKLAEILKAGQTEINNSLEKLKENLKSRGIVLLEKENPARNASPSDAGGEITLGTAPEFSGLIENLQKEELNKELSKASLETLSIVLYRNGASRSEIDYIRGVNSSFTLRALSIRGLVEKIPDPKDARRFLYRPSFELFSYMGIKSISDLPEYNEIHKETEIAAKNLEEESLAQES